MAEFTSADALVSAAGAVHQEGYTQIDALTPMPIDGLAEVMGYRRPPHPEDDPGRRPVRLRWPVSGSSSTST